MAYLTNLKWISDFAEYSPEEKKVLLALSHDKYKWRTRDRLQGVTRMESKELDLTLAHLLEDDLVRPSFSKKRNIIFGLMERVGKG